MNSDKLEALRSKYASAKGGDIFDPAFAAVAATVFVDADQRKWPFAGVATLLGAPMLAPDPASAPREFGAQMLFTELCLIAANPKRRRAT